MDLNQANEITNHSEQPAFAQKSFTSDSEPSLATSPWNAASIRTARRQRNQTQAELAFALGCRQQTISEWELGMYAPKNAYQKILSQYFSKDAVTAQDEPIPTPILEPKKEEFFLVTQDQLIGTAKYMAANNLEVIQIGFKNAQSTFRLFGTPNQNAANG